MNVEDLLRGQLISYEEFEAYILFSNSEMGKQWFDRMTLHTFMDEPSPENCNGLVFAYMDGRRSIFRNIRSIIDKVNQLIKGTPDDNNGTEDE